MPKEKDIWIKMYWNIFKQTWSEYYGNNWSVSIEVIFVDRVFEKENGSNNNIPSCEFFVFHSLMSDDSSYYGAATEAHIKKLLQWLCENTYIYTIVNAILEDTSGFS